MKIYLDVPEEKKVEETERKINETAPEEQEKKVEETETKTDEDAAVEDEKPQEEVKKKKMKKVDKTYWEWELMNEAKPIWQRK